MSEREAHDKMDLLLERFSGALLRTAVYGARIGDLLADHPELAGELTEEFKRDARDFTRMLTVMRSRTGLDVIDRILDDCERSKQHNRHTSENEPTAKTRRG